MSEAGHRASAASFSNALDPIRHTDTGNAKRLWLDHGEDFRWVQARRSFIIWDGWRFRPDDVVAMTCMAKATVRGMHAQVADEEDDRERKSLPSTR